MTTLTTDAASNQNASNVKGYGACMADMEDEAREWGRRNPGFIKPSVLKEPKKVKVMGERVAQMKRDLETPTDFTCSFCGQSFSKNMARAVHQSQCDKNPNATKWVRLGKKPRGAPPCNQNARKYKPTEKIPMKEAAGQSIPDTIRLAWNIYLMDADESMNINQLARDFLKKIVNGELLK
jgi:hypothetical protein